jgi:hypothetical protein
MSHLGDWYTRVPPGVSLDITIRDWRPPVRLAKKTRVQASRSDAVMANGEEKKQRRVPHDASRARETCFITVLVHIRPVPIGVSSGSRVYAVRNAPPCRRRIARGNPPLWNGSVYSNQGYARAMLNQEHTALSVYLG